MTFEYKFNSEHLSWIFEQVWEADEKYDGTFKVYNDLGAYEYDQIKDYIPSSISNVLECGAGLGRGSIYLNHLWQNTNIRWILADRDGKSAKNTGAFEPKEDEYYNNFELAKSFCRMNGMTNFAMFDTEKDDWRQLPKFDLIFSFCSFGMHVPIERYIDRLLEVSEPNVTMIFGTRHRGYGPQSFKDKFNEVIYKESLKVLPFPVENWLILKGKK
jgi:SAM-dependent methyltransferase